MFPTTSKSEANFPNRQDVVKVTAPLEIAQDTIIREASQPETTQEGFYNGISVTEEMTSPNKSEKGKQILTELQMQ